MTESNIVTNANIISQIMGSTSALKILHACTAGSADGSDDGDEYVQISYKCDIGKLCEEEYLCRSIVLKLRQYPIIETHYTKYDIMSISPAKYIPYDHFTKNHPFPLSNPDEPHSEYNRPIFPANIIMTEIIEGTMINMFYDNDIERWEISTKTQFGGNSTCPSTDATYNTYRSMLFEALGVSKFEYNALDKLPFLETIPKNWCYSFVLQHPANHIVYDIEIPRALLVAVYQKMTNGDIEYISPLVYREYFGNLFKYPQIFTKESIGDLFYSTEEMWVRYRSGSALKEVNYESIAEYFGEREYYWRFVGVMITNTDTGERTKIVNKEYKRVKQIRGNQPNMEKYYNEMVQRKDNSEYVFLSHFPRYMELFYEYSKKTNTESLSL